MAPRLMSPKGSRTPADLWWVAIIVVGVATFAMGWTTVTSLVVSTGVAGALGVGHIAVTIARRKRE